MVVSAFERPVVRHRLVALYRTVAAIVGGAALAVAWPSASHAANGSRPCDIYGASGTPCVAAHSTTRALYVAYDGPLYRVARGDDRREHDIGPLVPGGVADSAAQDAFCAGTACVITRIYDQSPSHNDLTIEGRGGNGAADRGAVANALPVVVEGRRVYGLFIMAGMGYRDNDTRGVARGGEPETMYMVASGTHVNQRCCFDYGNADSTTTIPATVTWTP